MSGIILLKMKPWFIKAFLLFLFLKCASIFALFIFLQRRERDIFWEVKGQINLPKFEAAADHTTELALLHSSWSVNWRSSFLASVVLTKQPLALKIYISIKFINFLLSKFIFKDKRELLQCQAPAFGSFGFYFWRNENMEKRRF